MKKIKPRNSKELKLLVQVESINLGNIDTSDITDMSRIFERSKRIDFTGIDKWDTRNVIDMSCMFLGATYFNEDISSWDVRNVKNMAYI
ncbi:DUF285 domain-containing protein [Campylobacter lari]|nr:DUF285 domain-containing protein [Campylobacter lari]